jgi:cytochrome P450
MISNLPAGPRMPSLLQTIGNWCRPTAFMERGARRYGRRFTIRLLGLPPVVVISDPEEIKQIFMAPPEVLHPGEGARVLEPVVGRNSVILLDEAPHLEQRRLLLPAFHGERMQALSGLMTELAGEEIDSWPRDVPVVLHPRLQRLTLEIILRAVFGLERDARLTELRDLLTRALSFGESPLAALPPLPPALTRFGAPARLQRLLDRVDELLYALIDERRSQREEGADVLALLLAARHEDGSPMSPQELRDELITALVAGHETTASQLAWTFMCLARAPEVQQRLRRELDEHEGDEYLTATINEVMRLHPVLPNAEPRLVKQPVRIGEVDYEPGVVLFASALLVQRDPEVYPEPHAFQPERFLGSAPGTYTWLPFGGGRRRCLGASFALLEMAIVIRSVLSRCNVEPVDSAPEQTRRRGITFSPGGGALVVLSELGAEPGAAPRAPAEALAAPA